MRYLKYTLGIITQPLKTVRELIEDPHRFKVGLFGVLAMAVLYAATAFLLSARGISAGAPFLRLPSETYYFYQGFITIPVALASWLLMGSSICLTILESEKRYKDVLALIGLPYGILVLPLMWLPETIIAVGWPSVWNTEWWTMLTFIRVTLGTIWVYVICALAVKKLYGLTLVRSLLHTLVGLTVGIGASAIFLR